MSDLLIKSDRVQVGVVPEGGHLDHVQFTTAGGTFAPLHVAPWAYEHVPPDVPPMLRVLRGDFFCAPFGDSDVEPDEQRPHGSTANARWELVSRDEMHLELELSRRVLGARVRKRIHVEHGQALVYQEHVLEGGGGEIPIGHHAMLDAPETVYLSFSRWVWGGTMPTPLEPDPQRGRSLLAYPQQFASLAHVRLADGRTADASRYPFEERHEDLLMLVADARSPFAWSAVTAPHAGWVWFALKSPSTLRNTVLWMSNGGRSYPPWSNRHTRVLGVEETTSYFHLGHKASTHPNPLQAAGFPTAVRLRPEEPLRVRYAFGLAGVPAEFRHVHSIDPTPGGVTITDVGGQQVFAPANVGFVTGTGAPGEG
jgi:hypothetical protein